MGQATREPRQRKTIQNDDYFSVSPGASAGEIADALLLAGLIPISPTEEELNKFCQEYLRENYPYFVPCTTYSYFWYEFYEKPVVFSLSISDRTSWLYALELIRAKIEYGLLDPRAVRIVLIDPETNTEKEIAYDEAYISGSKRYNYEEIRKIAMRTLKKLKKLLPQKVEITEGEMRIWVMKYYY